MEAVRKDRCGAEKMMAKVKVAARAKAESEKRK